MKDGVPERKANRLATYNYSQSGVYFITICSKNKRCTFGTIVGGGVPDAPQAAARSKSITSHYILYSFAEFCYNGSIPFIIGHFEGVIL